MELQRILFLYLLTVLTLTSCFPSRPLNERSTELALQAWILFEQDQQDSNDNIHQDESTGYRRRITPKSVFLVPTFSPETLPPCAEGYKADAMGRCLKIVKIDNTAHMDYLFQVLLQKFQPNPNETKSDKPVSVAIPLPEEKQPEMLVVVAGANETKDAASTSIDGFFAGGLVGLFVSFYKKRCFIIFSLRIVTDVNKQSEETTTNTVDTTTTLQDQTTLPPEDNTSTEDLTTTTDSSETTTSLENQQALFFFNSDDDATADSETTTMKPKTGLPDAAHLDPVFSSQDAKQTANFVRFPSDDEYPSYASRFKHDYEFDNDDDHDFESDDHVPSPTWSSSQLSFRFPSRYRHSGRDFHSESYFRDFPGGGDVAHLFRHRPRGRFR